MFRRSTPTIAVVFCTFLLFLQSTDAGPRRTGDATNAPPADLQVLTTAKEPQVKKPQAKPDQTPTNKNKAPGAYTGAVGPRGGLGELGGPRQGGDTCASATVIGALPYSNSGTTVGYVDDYDSACPYTGSTSPDVVYSYTPAANESIDATLCTNSAYDTKLYIYAGVCSGTPVACNDDSCSTPSYPSAYVSRLTGVSLTGGTTYYLVVDGYGGDLGNYTIDVAGPPPCDVVCPPGGIPEGEPNCGLPTDTVNGGCNSTPPVFSPINCGETLCGTAAFDGSTRDTDWYRLMLTSATEVTWTAQSEFDQLVGIVDNGGIDDCAGVTAFLVFATSGPCTSASVTACLSPGVWWLFIAPQFTAAVPCGLEYVATLTCTPCGGVTIPEGVDCFNTECGDTFYDFAQSPIPCGFYDPGSEPFDDVVRLGGGDPNFADTYVRRVNAMSFGVWPDTQTVPIELVQLNLVSCSPITVRYCNGRPDELWDVVVALSPTPAPFGLMTVTKTHANGGVFSSQFFVQSMFTFIRQSDGAPRILDTGGLGIPPASLNSTNPAPWVHQSTLPIQICGVNFVPGIQEASVPPTPGSTCVSTAQCSKPVGHAGPGHLHVTGHTIVPCPCGACCDPATGGCTEISSPDPAADCAASGGVFKGIGSSCNSADGDSIPDSYETNNCCSPVSCPPNGQCSTPTDPTNADTDGDGLNDDVDPFPCNRCLPLSAPLRPAICDLFDLTLPGDGDCDDDGICDLCEIQAGTSHDCNNNGVPDECEPDCNNNGVPDDYDITCGTSLDVNGNGIPDECELVCPTCLGDINGDGLLDGLDIRCFVLCMLSFGGPGCNCGCADMDGSGFVDVLDIDPFVAFILAKPSECPVGELEEAAPVIGEGPGRLNFNVSVGLGGPFGGAEASGEGSLQLNQGPPSFFDVFWHSDGNPSQNIPAFTVQIPGTTPIQDLGSSTAWTLNGSVDVQGDTGPIEPDADVQVSLIGPPLSQLGEPGARYELDPGAPTPSVAVVRDPDAFGGLPPGTVIPITQHPVKIKKYCVYRIWASGPNPPIGNCPAGWVAGATLCVECDARQKLQCPPSGIYRVVGRRCVLGLTLQPPLVCWNCPLGALRNAKFFGWQNFPK